MSQPLSVLIVDDEWDIAHLFSLHLVGSGFDAISFTEPLLALNHFKQDPSRYCLVLVDLSMDDLNGVELAKEIRRHNSQVKILLITGHLIGDMLHDDDLREAQISEVIQKPVKLENLEARVVRLCSKDKVVGSTSKIR